MLMRQLKNGGQLLKIAGSGSGFLEWGRPIKLRMRQKVCKYIKPILHAVFCILLFFWNISNITAKFNNMFIIIFTF